MNSARPTVAVLLDNEFSWDSRVKKTTWSLAQAGYDITVFACEDDDKALPKCEPLENGITVYRVFQRRQFLRSAWDKRELTTLLNTVKPILPSPDIIHANDVFTLPLALTWKQNSHALCVYDAHEYWQGVLPYEHTYEAKEIPRRLKRWLTKIKLYRHRQAWLEWEQRGLKEADKVTTVSPSILNELVRQRKHKPHDVALVRNVSPLEPTLGTPEKRLHHALNIPTNTRILLYQGFIEPKKGLLEIAQQYHALTQSEWIFVMMGPIMDYDFYHHVLEQSPQSTVFYHPPVYGSDLVHYTHSADLGVITIPAVHLSYRWCLPNKLFAYVQGELPSLSLAELEDTSALIKHWQIGTSIMSFPDLPKLLLNPNLPTDLQSWRRHCQQAKAILCWEKEQNTLIQVYDALKQQRQQPTTV